MISMKIRILSDTHYDPGLNGDGDFDALYEDKLKPADLTLFAGDVCVLPEHTNEFLNKYVGANYCYFVCGNHMEYRRDRATHRKIIRDYKKAFPLTHCYYRFLENDYQFIPGTCNQVAIIGSIFYTDYKYCDYTLEDYKKRQFAWNIWMNAYGLKSEEKPIKRLTKKMIVEENMMSARGHMNDFKWGHKTKFTLLDPIDYLNFHKKAKKEVLKCYNSILSINPNAKIILMTHHCLSPKCIDEKYSKSPLNSSFTSDLEKWIDEKMPKVRLVVSGHVHSRCDFRFGKNNIRYICNPVGYIAYGENKKEPPFNPDLIIDTKDL